MNRIYAEECYFFRVDNGSRCAARQKWCFLCPFHYPVIESLHPRDYIGLGSNRISGRISFGFSVIALAVSVIALISQ